jgi:hypothetical protein
MLLRGEPESLNAILDNHEGTWLGQLILALKLVMPRR